MTLSKGKTTVEAALLRENGSKPTGEDTTWRYASDRVLRKYGR